MSRLNVIYLQQSGADRHRDDVLMEMVGQGHDVRVFDPLSPIEEQFAGVDAVVDMGGANGKQEFVDAAKSAKLWQIVTVGYDFFDVDMLASAGIPVCHCPGSTSALGLGEGAIMFMLMIVHRFKEAQQIMSEGKVHVPMGSELEGQSLGLVGFGASGRELARLAKSFGMRLMIVEPMDIPQEFLDEYGPEFVGTPSEMDRIFAEADFVSLHLPLNPETMGIVNKQKIDLMKPSASFINLSRGDLVDQSALFTALLENRIAGIGIDVHAGVIPDTSHPVFQHPNFYALPHIAGTTRGTVRRRVEICVENLNRLAADEDLLHRIV